jgi:hypothetical protein
VPEDMDILPDDFPGFLCREETDGEYYRYWFDTVENRQRYIDALYVKETNGAVD